MKKPLSVTLLLVGVLLLVMGISAAESVASELSELFGGAPSGKAIWLLVGGILLIAVGGVPLVRRSA